MIQNLRPVVRWLTAMLLLGSTGFGQIGKIALSIDTTTATAEIPADYVGLSISRASISGSNHYTRIFDPADAHYRQLVALFRQIGIRHLRTISGAARSAEPDPTPQQNDAFFQFARDAGITGREIIYSLHLCNADQGDAATDNLATARRLYREHRDQLQAFALDNETDFPGNLKKDPSLRTYADYRKKWEEIRLGVLAVAPGVPFCGPDTGSNYPVPNGQDTSVAGVPWTLQFARDERANVVLITQHYYCINDTIPPRWEKGMSVGRYDVVADPLDPACPGAHYISNSAGPSNEHPAAEPSRWSLTTAPGAISQIEPRGVRQGRGIWAAGTAYAVGDEVQDPQDACRVYVCLSAGIGRIHPAAESRGRNPRWKAEKPRNCPGPTQLSVAALSAQQDENFARLDAAALLGHHGADGWPSAPVLPYRLTEASPFSGGENPAAQVFASALLGLDLFHWFAQHGCAGLDPFARLVQRNSPIYFDGSNDVAAPYAYAMLAFTLAGPGNLERPVAKFDAPANLNLTAYATGNRANTDLYVTLINKTSRATGAIEANVTLETKGFVATAARSIALTGSEPGDATSPVARLGGAIIPNDGRDFSGQWTPETAKDGICTVVVPSATAKIVHLRR